MHRSQLATCLVAVLTAVLVVTVPTRAQRVSDVERRYQAALHVEQVEGNLPAARKAYEGLAAATNGSAEIRLKALVRQAALHDTLGLASDELYQRVVREFPARPEADAARRKLAARQTPAPAPLPQLVTPTRTVTGFYVARLDSSGHLGPWESRVLQKATVSSYVQIAPDNQHVVYVTGPTARVQDITNPADPGRDLYKGAGTLTACIWARTQMKVFCGERVEPTDVATALQSLATEVVAIDYFSLTVERLGRFGGVRFPLHVSPDDTVLSFNKDSSAGSPEGTGGISWVIGTDPSTESPLTRNYATDRSEDGLWVVDGERIVPASGDGPSIALNRNVPRTPGFLPASIRFTPDSQWVIYRGRDAEGRDGVYRTSLGGAKERLGDHPQVAPSARAWLRFSPDGQLFLAAVDQLAQTK
jgi:hypothetical protein